MRGFRHQAGIILSPVFWAGFFLLFSAQIFRAELLPIKTYFSTDGLIYDKIYRIYQDSRGFVWFSTPAGISRFDGYQFLSYGLENGLAENSMITDSVEDENGVYWFSTSASGVYRFDPRPARIACAECIKHGKTKFWSEPITICTGSYRAKIGSSASI